MPWHTHTHTHTHTDTHTHTQVMDNKTMELDTVKLVDICKDLSQALAYLHAQVGCSTVSAHMHLVQPLHK